MSLTKRWLDSIIENRNRCPKCNTMMRKAERHYADSSIYRWKYYDKWVCMTCGYEKKVYVYDKGA